MVIYRLNCCRNSSGWSHNNYIAKNLQCNHFSIMSWYKKILTAWATQTLAKWNIEKVFAEGLQSTSSTIWLIYPVTTAPVVHDGTILHTRQLQRGTLSNELCLDNKIHGAKWGSPGSCWPQMGPILAPWTLLSGDCLQRMDCVHCDLSGFHTQSMTSHSPPGNHTHTPTPIVHCRWSQFRWLLMKALIFTSYGP